ncbi:MAG: CPBP family intramembrane glutamic endopeptidase [Pseudomonadota bacterium]
MAFALALGLSLLAAAVLSPAVQALLAPVHLSQLHRIFNRLTMIGVLATTIRLLVSNGLASRKVLGYAAPARVFARQALTGLVAGLALMMLILVPLFALHIRVWNHNLPVDLAGLLEIAAKALLTGCAVALVEETYFRGAIQGSLARTGSVRVALFVVPILYAAIHFFGEAVRIPIEHVTPTSGFTILAGFMRKFAYPKQIADAFLALYVLGVLLALVRHYTGNVAGCIGLHAAFASAVIVTRGLSAPGPDSAWMLLVGRFDHVLGIWAAIVGIIACWGYWAISTRESIASTETALSTER